MSKSPVISLQDVAVSYRQKKLFGKARLNVLNDVSFDLFSGESLGVIGRNGAGKSTVLKLLAGVILPDKGSVINAGVKTALLALQAGFENELNGIDNIYLNGMLIGFSRQEVENRIAAIIDYSELGESIYRPVKTYSVGMRARLGFSIGYQLQADVLLIDEALGVGDAEFRQKSTRAMREKIKSEQTVVLVSHNANLIKNHCNRAVWIEDGRLKMIGNAGDVVSEYEQFISVS